MKLKIEERLKAVALREKGFSVNEIVSRVGVAKSSISTWVRNVPLSPAARKRLLTKIKLGQRVSAENKHRKVEDAIESYFQDALQKVRGSKLNKFYRRVICSLLYWCEGIKDHYSGVGFVNSDPKLIKTFLRLFRESFEIDEKRFSACIHLHEYHNPAKQLRFWSEITGIPPHQFMKPYRKPNTGKRVRKEYPGCVAVRYHNNDIARQLLSTARAFMALNI